MTGGQDIYYDSCKLIFSFPSSTTSWYPRDIGRKWTPNMMSWMHLIPESRTLKMGKFLLDEMLETIEGVEAVIPNLTPTNMVLN